MGLLDKILPGRRHENKPGGVSFQTVTEDLPVFSAWDGSIYEQQLTRSAIHAFATACSKFSPEHHGTAKSRLTRAFETSPNAYSTWPRFLYRVATMYEVDDTVAIVPTFGGDLNTITGIWPLKFDYAEVMTYHGEPWVRFYLPKGDAMAIELENVCLLSKYQYASDLFGTANVLDTTMRLIDAQVQAQEAAIKNGASIRFIGAVDGMMKDSDIEKKRDKFTEDNLSSKNQSGLMIYDATFRDLKQVTNQSYTIDNAEMERIKNDVFNYFGVNEDILQNRFDESTWNAFYEGKCEPFAIQLGEGLSHMLYTQRERANNWVSFSSNRLEYSSTESKRKIIGDLYDRAVITKNEGREILQLPPVEGGDEFVIRGEYISASLINEHTVKDASEAAQANALLNADDDDDNKDEEEGEGNDAVQP